MPPLRRSSARTRISPMCSWRWRRWKPHMPSTAIRRCKCCCRNRNWKKAGCVCAWWKRASARWSSRGRSISAKRVCTTRCLPCARAMCRAPAQIARELKLANENPARQLNVVLKAGKKDDQVDADVQVTDQKPSTFGVSFDNTGTTETGHTRLGLVLPQCQPAERGSCGHPAAAGVAATHEPCARVRRRLQDSALCLRRQRGILRRLFQRQFHGWRPDQLPGRRCAAQRTLQPCAGKNGHVRSAPDLRFRLARFQAHRTDPAHFASAVQRDHRDAVEPGLRVRRAKPNAPRPASISACRPTCR